MKVHERIAQRRKDLRITQECVARELGITKTNISRMEAGKAAITVERLSDLARILRTTPAALLGEEATSVSTVTREEAGVLALYQQLDDEYKTKIVDFMRLEVKRKRALEAIEAGMDSLRKEDHDGAVRKR